MRTHQLRKLVARPVQHAQPVVVRERVQKVLDRRALLAALGDAGRLEELGHDLGFIAGGEGRGVEDGGELGVGFEGFGEGVDGFGCGVEGGGFGGGGVLMVGR